MRKLLKGRALKCQMSQIILSTRTSQNGCYKFLMKGYFGKDFFFRAAKRHVPIPTMKKRERSRFPHTISNGEVELLEYDRLEHRDQQTSFFQPRCTTVDRH